MEAEAPSLIPIYAGSGSIVCIASVLLLYNLIVLVGQIRQKSDEAVSGMAKAAWALSVVSLFLGPCIWLGALVSIVLGRVERGRIYRGESTIASATAARMAALNGWFALLFLLAAIIVGVIQYV